MGSGATPKRGDSYRGTSPPVAGLTPSLHHPCSETETSRNSTLNSCKRLLEPPNPASILHTSPMASNTPLLPPPGLEFGLVPREDHFLKPFNQSGAGEEPCRVWVPGEPLWSRVSISPQLPVQPLGGIGTASQPAPHQHPGVPLANLLVVWHRAAHPKTRC